MSVAIAVVLWLIVVNIDNPTGTNYYTLKMCIRDRGTRNSLAYSTGKGLVLNEPSIVVYDKNTEKIRAIGEEARLMEGRITSDMEIIRPIRQGVIVDYTEIGRAHV